MHERLGHRMNNIDPTVKNREQHAVAVKDASRCATSELHVNPGSSLAIRKYTYRIKTMLSRVADN